MHSASWFAMTMFVGAAACHPDLYPELAAMVVRGDLQLARHAVMRPFIELAEAIADSRSGISDRVSILVPEAL